MHEERKPKSILQKR